MRELPWVVGAEEKVYGDEAEKGIPCYAESAVGQLNKQHIHPHGGRDILP